MVGRNAKGQFLQGRIEPIEIKEKRLKSCSNAWRNREVYHGFYGTKIYNTWRSIRSRCSDNATGDARKKYYLRGVVCCDRWSSFKNFLEDMLDTYQDGLQLDRIDNSKGYYKENCRWVTSKENNNNRTNNVKIEYNNEVKTLSEWADTLGINFSTIRNRYYKFYKKGKYGIDRVFQIK